LRRKRKKVRVVDRIGILDFFFTLIVLWYLVSLIFTVFTYYASKPDRDD
jgi:hypothetical protein